MAPFFSFGIKPSLRFFARRRALPVVLLLGALLAGPARADDTYGPNIFPAGTFDAVKATYVPWAGVDAQGIIHGIDGSQISVGEDGGIRNSNFGPSVAAADMDGDGKPDLVLADSTGFFWYFPNTGTAQKPAFTQGDVTPIWLGDDVIENSYEGVNDIVPRLQLIDLDGSKKFDVIAGTYAGKFFHVPNVGSGLQPSFRPTFNRDLLTVKTHRNGLLWCNYLSPFMTSAFGSGNGLLDLIVGEGTYSANSIYLLRNTGSNMQPSFDENHFSKIIPGMGLEQITPVVLDWNNDGKPDVLCGSRTGTVTLYLNNSTDPSNPTFATGQAVPIGGITKLGDSITVSLADLTGNKLPNLIIGKNDGTVWYALNTGKLGSPSFTTPMTPLKGVLPPEYHHTIPLLWQKNGCWGAPYELLSCVNPQLQPDFTFPDGVTSKYALKFWVWPHKSALFPDRYYPRQENWENEHTISCLQGLTLKLNKRYRLHFWVKTEGNVDEFRFRLVAARVWDPTYEAPDVMRPVSSGGGWSEVSEDIRIDNSIQPATKTWNYKFEFRFRGQAPFYIDDLSIKEAL